jgi:hypothetical protein
MKTKPTKTKAKSPQPTKPSLAHSQANRHRFAFGRRFSNGMAASASPTSGQISHHVPSLRISERHYA